MTLRPALLLVAAFAVPTAARAQLVSLTEGFESGAALTTAGWTITNLSNPIGANLTGWGQVQAQPFPAHAGPADSNMVANFEAVAGAGTINAWLVTPQLELNSSATTLTFFTRTVPTVGFPDRMQVRLSTAGASGNVGTSPTDVGDFTTLLLDINPTYSATAYPTTYTQFTVEIPQQAADGRLAFRYFVENGGPAGTNSDLIGVDTFVFAPVPEPASVFGLSAAVVAGGTALRRRRAARAA